MSNERIAEQSTKSLNEGSLTYEHCNNEALRFTIVRDSCTTMKKEVSSPEPHGVEKEG